MDEGAFLLRYFGIKKALAAQFANECKFDNVDP